MLFRRLAVVRPLFALLALLGTLAVLVSAGLPARMGWNAAPRSHGQLPQSIYLWQRAWTADVRQSLSDHGTGFHSVIVLASQIQWHQQTPTTLRFDVDWNLLHHASIHPAAAIRIGTFSGNFSATAPIIAAAVTELLDLARLQGISLAEVQLDFDAPTSHLAGYRTWLAAAQHAAGATPVTFTALPSWLSSPDFPSLARQLPSHASYILQVHGIEKPRRAADPLLLCDPAAARNAIERAARVGVPFRVALPTYGYLVAFHADGTFGGIAGEDAPPNWASGAGCTIRTVSAQPTELATLVHSVAVDHPALLMGIIWYRLPIDSDSLNWRWPTLLAVMAGRTPSPAHLDAAPRPTSEGVTDILLQNTGESPATSLAAIDISWPTGTTLIASDALANFDLEPLDSQHARLVAPAQALPAPGEQRVAGWLRFQPSDAEVTLHVH